MKLTDLLKEPCIVPALRSRDKNSVLRELVETLSSSEPEAEREHMYTVLLERESLGSTGIGNGVAIPHGKSDHIRRILVSFGRSLEGVDFDSMDGKPAFLFFVLVAPRNSSEIHLKVLAKISKMLKDKDFRTRLLKAESREDLYRIILEHDQEI